MENTLKWSYLGCLEYEKATRIQEELQSRMIKDNSDVSGYLLILEHKPVITAGKFGNDNNLLITDCALRQSGIDIFKANRGGDYTYHGPGQIVCYPILDLRRIGMGVKDYVYNLEELIIDVLGNYGIISGRREGYPGVWTGDKKIAFIGINVKRYVSMHGFSLNYDVDTVNYTYMNPCGINGLEVVSIRDLYGGDLDMDNLVKQVVSSFIKIFNCTLIEEREVVT